MRYETLRILRSPARVAGPDWMAGSYAKTCFWDLCTDESSDSHAGLATTPPPLSAVRRNFGGALS